MSAEAYLPPDRSDLAALRAASRGCRGCPLFARATQTVFGTGPTSPRAMLIGEQPGAKEDLRGEPFVGPAGQLLRATLEEIGVDPGDVYLTNAVKHFKWQARGKVRLHKKPSASEIEACKPWILAEITAVRPPMTVCLGANAAQALLGARFKVTERRGELLSLPSGLPVTATVHPSSILRIRPEADRHRERERFRADLYRALVEADR